MKKILGVLIIALSLFASISLILAENTQENNDAPVPTLYSTEVISSNNNSNETILGASCGTVTPGYQNECCQRKGYGRWDSEKLTCINETESNSDTGCTAEYAPVCGLVQIRCIQVPCNPIYQTFSNRCELNKNKLAKFVHEGECNEKETENNTKIDEETPIACTMDAKMCPDGTYVSRIGPKCEFAPCPKEYNISKERVCCKVYGYGAQMAEVNVHYKITEKRECRIPEGFVGGNREIVNNSYCIEQIKENRQELIEKMHEIMRERNKIKNYYINQSECPDNCSCSGSTIKCSFENETKIMTVHAGNSGNVIVQVKNTNASTNVTLYKSDGKVYGVFKDNETKVIILPDEARERIKEREQNKEGKRANWTNENITLNQEGYYEIQAKKKARLFWIVPVKEKFQSHVDAETGEVVHIRKAWWGFLARDVKER